MRVIKSQHSIAIALDKRSEFPTSKKPSDIPEGFLIQALDGAGDGDRTRDSFLEN